MPADRCFRWGRLIAATLTTLAAAWMLKEPCRDPELWDGRQLRQLCYSDFVPMWTQRGLDRGLRPYLDVAFEYPALSGGMATVAAAGSKTAREFFDRCAGILAVCAVVSVLAFAVALGG